MNAKTIFCDQWHDKDYDCDECAKGENLADKIISTFKQELLEKIEKIPVGGICADYCNGDKTTVEVVIDIINGDGGYED